MKIVHDIWVNWSEGEEHAYNIPHFHEWKKKDPIEIFDQIPLVWVSEKLFDYIEDGLNEIPQDLLNEVHQRSYIKKGKDRDVVDFAFMMCDEQRALVIDTVGEDIPIRKSRLIHRQERLAVDLIEQKTKNENATPYDLEGDVPKKTYHNLSMRPEEVVGLTRKEKEQKQVLIMSLDLLKDRKDIAEVRYWITEHDPYLYEEIQDKSFEECFELLCDLVRHGWSEKHYKLVSILSQTHDLTKRMMSFTEHEEKVS